MHYLGIYSVNEMVLNVWAVRMYCVDRKFELNNYKVYPVKLFD
jgi:hypothetical protein